MPFEAPVRALLEAKNFAHVATIRKDGRPYVIPVWVHTDGEHVIVNSAEGRSLAQAPGARSPGDGDVANMENPYEYVQITGTVAERTHDDADEVIDSLAKKYMNVDEYPFRQAGEQRVTIRITPEKVMHNAPG
jgi:PPOX class probable F420-dependent enzyme